jgi:MacB-like periplasmic core domain
MTPPGDVMVTVRHCSHIWVLCSGVLTDGVLKSDDGFDAPEHRAEPVAPDAVEPGFHSERVPAAKVSRSASRYRTPAAVADFHRRVLERVRTLPDVQSGGATAFLPLGGTTNTWGFQIEHQPSPKTSAGYRPATAGFIESMRIPLINGRTFTDADSADAPRAVLISETLRRTYLANQEAVGRRLRLLDPTMESRTIVGAVGDVRHDGLADETRGPRRPGRAPAARVARGPTTPKLAPTASRVAAPNASPSHQLPRERHRNRTSPASRPIVCVRTVSDAPANPGRTL